MLPVLLLLLSFLFSSPLSRASRCFCSARCVCLLSLRCSIHTMDHRLDINSTEVHSEHEGSFPTDLQRHAALASAIFPIGPSRRPARAAAPSSQPPAAATGASAPSAAVGGEAGSPHPILPPPIPPSQPQAVFVVAPPPQIVPLITTDGVPRCLQMVQWAHAMSNHQLQQMVTETMTWLRSTRASASRQAAIIDLANVVIELYNTLISQQVKIDTVGGGWTLLNPPLVRLMRGLWQAWADNDSWPEAARRHVGAELTFQHHDLLWGLVRGELARVEAEGRGGGGRGGGGGRSGGRRRRRRRFRGGGGGSPPPTSDAGSRRRGSDAGSRRSPSSTRSGR